MHDITPYLADKGRGAEVRDWLQKRPEIERFVIIDDEHFDSFATH